MTPWHYGPVESVVYLATLFLNHRSCYSSFPNLWGTLKIEHSTRSFHCIVSLDAPRNLTFRHPPNFHIVLHCTIAKNQARCKVHGEKTRKAAYRPSHITVIVEKLTFIKRGAISSSTNLIFPEYITSSRSCSSSSHLLLLNTSKLDCA